ncbi:type 2 isopentenyl-diphosphate Delta-isomerase [Mycolicibacterium sp. jd]|uniref:Isopentenyl-diphosphate delta-isomerase n=1 Tax=Mycolicibacterium vanbaalenii (strain DSM 7251 / JCM 13017 / BCRC 16820 / KCTC 9966 / NRRL B-24157 / PYR-1) TaxID=350058 RepID=IDI2_MYCVP|nr:MULTISPECIES: type 2 isopentenyl-diphosphate Delta-isomerase [Mycolicibacterium]A1T741.1 RecName: Full=Isopentenyl-diphosphate delta-isomerase; Short=IPP isomerase; AltName: Full=Isopentenyl diphosphate:dimethylallyl diphosphate isomerase; AltName: Full=Isopentenyl pyrophosphate isomerase; AltName: Full=Type 2 isopentenyl diphosphate isomerase; Short=IDI-2 [Mycolicibacterium vanbaalenii PYR-1]ABM12991.1 isopentenyl-diphosphate delta-isomerase, type 2 [Mycolicibacterium vanbaalenii PYR-1]QZT58
MTSDPGSALQHRKRRHIDVCLTEAVDYQSLTTGFERYRLPYNALTQTDLHSVDLSTEFLGSHLRAPVLIGAMTGGAALSGIINRNLAAAAQQLGIGMMLGSQRVMIDDEAAAASFEVRGVAPDILLIGNIGLAQLRSSMVPGLAAALDRVGANGLAVHTNPLQEAMQHDGDTDFSGSIGRLCDVAGAIGYPVVLKEVGHGIGAAAAAELVGCPIAAIDVAGAGGTSWARIEQFVRYGDVRYPALAEWGVPTAQALTEVRQMLPDVPLVASGGIRTGMDAAKALAMGARVVAVARPLLAPAVESVEAVVDWLQRFIDELLVCLHGCGAANLSALRGRGVTELP